VTLKVTPTKLNFGSVKVHSQSKPKGVKIANPKGSRKHIGMTVLFESVLAAGDYTVSASDCGATLAPGQACNLSIVFHPSAGLDRPAALTIRDNASGAPHHVSLFGKGS
jgi:hypothetical protein